MAAQLYLDNSWCLEFQILKFERLYYMSLLVRKLAFCTCENKDADQLRCKLISAFVFATRKVQSLYFINPKFQASSHLLWLYSPVRVRSGRKSRRPVFSHRGSNLGIQTTKAKYGFILNELHHEKTWFLHMRKQIHRSAAQ